MASGTSNLSSHFKQKKSGAGAASKALKKLSAGIPSSLQDSTAALGRVDVDDGKQELEEMLMQFDMNMKYGPCLGMTRLERWERAERLGMNPPIEVRNILERMGGAPVCLWEGRV